MGRGDKGASNLNLGRQNHRPFNSLADCPFYSIKRRKKCMIKRGAGRHDSDRKEKIEDRKRGASCLLEKTEMGKNWSDANPQGMLPANKG